MSAPVGNRFWEVRGTHGRAATFNTPEEMWEAACEYFQWVEDNPLKAEKLFSHNGAVVRGEYSKMRAMTVEGLCNFIGITSRCWRGYRDKEDFFPVMDMVDQIIYAQKFEGASADLLNPNIIARDLGLADKKDHTTNGKDMPPQQIILRAADDDSNS